MLVAILTALRKTPGLPSRRGRQWDHRDRYAATPHVEKQGTTLRPRSRGWKKKSEPNGAGRLDIIQEI